MDLEKRNIAVIGCGMSGLNAIKACVEEGMNPVCFEQHGQIGKDSTHMTPEYYP